VEVRGVFATGYQYLVIYIFSYTIIKTVEGAIPMDAIQTSVHLY